MDKPNVITLNLKDCSHLGELHQIIKKAFDFPDYYGENWDAFWDLIRGTRSNTIVEIRGVSSFSADLKKQIEQMIAALEENKEEMKKLKERRPAFDCRFDYRFID